MGRQAESRTIDDIDVTVQQLPARRGERVFHRIMTAVGPALGAAAGGLGDGGAAVLDMDVDLGEAIRVLFDRLTWQELESIQKELLETAQVTIDGKTGLLLPVVDELLAGKVGTLLKITAFAVEVNFRDLFLLASSAGGLLARVRPSTSPKTSPASGPAGGSSSKG